MELTFLFLQKRIERHQLESHLLQDPNTTFDSSTGVRMLEGLDGVSRRESCRSVGRPNEKICWEVLPPAGKTD